MTAACQPLVSVVIPVRDRRDLLDRALRSVRAQDLPGVDIVVVDDGSDVPIEIAAKDVRVVRNIRSLGAQRSRLIGAEAAAGRFVALLDSDDWWHSEKLRRQLALAEAQPGVIVSCRVVAARGTLRRAAPWRPLAHDERVEDFLYVHRGMLQTSTVFAAREIVCDLLRSSADGRVHNDTMLFLEAQRRGLTIRQMPDALSFFDDNPRPDRVSYDHGRVQASEAWFHAVSGTWSPAACRGFMLTDMVTRYINTGQRWKAVKCLARSYHPRIGFDQYFKKIAYVLFNGSPFRILHMSD